MSIKIHNRKLLIHFLFCLLIFFGSGVACDGTADEFYKALGKISLIKSLFCRDIRWCGVSAYFSKMPGNTLVQFWSRLHLMHPSSDLTSYSFYKLF